jgi:hypothetical protein
MDLGDATNEFDGFPGKFNLQEVADLEALEDEPVFEDTPGAQFGPIMESTALTKQLESRKHNLRNRIGNILARPFKARARTVIAVGAIAAVSFAVTHQVTEKGAPAPAPTEGSSTSTTQDSCILKVAAAIESNPDLAGEANVLINHCRESGSIIGVLTQTIQPQN